MEPNVIVDEVPEDEFQDYATEVAKSLCKGDDGVKSVIEDFMFSDELHGASEAVIQSNFPPFDLPTGERLLVEISIARRDTMFQIEIKHASSHGPQQDDSLDQYTREAMMAAAGQPVDQGPGLESFLADGRLVEEYAREAKEAGLKINPLVERSIIASQEARHGLLFLDAQGNHPVVFKSRLGDKDAAVLARVFEGPAQYLARLDLAYNEITDLGITSLAQGLIGPKAVNLQSLSLRGNSIGWNGCERLTHSLRHCRALRQIDLAQNPLGRLGGLKVVELLQSLQDLQELFLADTKIDIDVLVAISALLLTGVSHLRVIDLEKPMIQTLQEEHTVHIGRMLRVNVHLSEVYLGKHRMRDDGVRQLVSFLLENKTLRVLDLRCNELGAEGARHLAKLLAADCQLRRLNLEGNRIGEKANVSGAKAIADALLQNMMLSQLNLNNNSLCGDALGVIAEAIEKNSTLETVELFHNNWDQPSSYKFHQIFNDRARMQPLRADFVTSEVDLRIDVCQLQGFRSENGGS